MEYLGFYMWPNHTWKVYENIGKSIAGLSSHCNPNTNDDNHNETKSCYQSLLENLRTKYTQEVNNNDGIVNDLVLSDEVFTRNRAILTNYEELETFQKDVHDIYNLKVVVTYRRYEDWYPSARRQINLRSQKTSTWIGPIKSQFPMALKHARKNSHQIYPAPAELIQTLQQQNSTLDISVFNFHENSDNMMETFACTILQNAHHTCQLSKLPNSTKVYMASDKEVKDDLLFDEIVSMAADIGLVDSTLLKRKVAVTGARIWYQEIQNHTTMKDIPMKCPTDDELNEYLQLSLDVEKQIIPEFVSSEVEEAHKQTFWDAAKSNKYCSVDTDIVMKDPEWLVFFQTVIKRLYKFNQRAKDDAIRKKLMKPT